MKAPTHALSLSQPETRTEAVSKGADPVHAAIGLREWLSTLDASISAKAPCPRLAVFDTRVHKARHLPGSAARSVARTMRKSGLRVADRVSFYVDDITGPVTLGEHQRARDWGRELATPTLEVRSADDRNHGDRAPRMLDHGGRE